VVAVITTITRMSDDLPWLASLLQVSDSSFPTGGYAHSAGFEQVVQLQLVRDAATLAEFIDRHVWPSLAHFELPVVRLAQEAAQRQDVSALLALDEIVEATKGSRELRLASRALGQRRRHALDQIKLTSLPVTYARAIDADETPGHHAVIFGAGLAALPTRALLTAWAFQGLNLVCLAAPKLLRIGQDAVQRVLAGALAGMDANLEISLTIERDELGWFDPALEIASMQHEIAHERLFIS
jgi:urease accessory protein